MSPLAKSFVFLAFAAIVISGQAGSSKEDEIISLLLTQPRANEDFVLPADEEFYTLGDGETKIETDVRLTR